MTIENRFKPMRINKLVAPKKSVFGKVIPLVTSSTERAVFVSQRSTSYDGRRRSVKQLEPKVNYHAQSEKYQSNF